MNARNISKPPFGPRRARSLSFSLGCGAVVLLTAVAATAADPAASAGSASNVVLTATQREKIHTLTIRPSTFHRAIDTTGTVDFDQDQATTVLAPISGPVSELKVALGAKVNRGDVLATVASPDFATDISSYRKAVATATNARRIAELTRELSKNNLPRKEVEQAQTDAANADADRDAALEQLRSLGVDDATIKAIQQNQTPSNLVGMIRAPIAGTVVEKLITPGQLLQAGTTPCFTVADLSKVWVTANVFEADLSAIQKGDAADILTSASSTNLSGVVDYISAIVDPNTRAVGVRIVAENPNDTLKKQMYVRVRIHSKRAETGLLAPVSAVLRNDEDLPFVYIANSDGDFSRRRISLSARLDDSYLTTAGLKSGDQVVIDGGLFLQFLQSQ